MISKREKFLIGTILCFILFYFLSFFSSSSFSILSNNINQNLNNKQDTTVNLNSNQNLNKIAILLTGAPRSLCNLLPFFYSNIIEPNTIYSSKDNNKLKQYPSVFLCSVYKTKEELNCLENYVKQLGNPEIIKNYYFEEYKEEVIVKRFYNENQIKILNEGEVIEPEFPGIHFIQKNRTIGLLNYGSSLYLMHHCNLLRKQLEERENFKHDLVIRMRTDFLAEHLVPLLNFKVKPKTLYLGKAMHHGGFNDHFGFGDANTMDLYFEVYKKLREIALTNKYHNWLWGIHPETVLRHWLHNLNGVKPEEVPIYFQVIRDIQFRDHATINSWFRKPIDNLYERNRLLKP
ncbi:hypothetical protein ABK040_014073 [Willaertia magna]